MRTMLLAGIIGFFLSAGVCRGQGNYPPTLPPITPAVPPSLPPPSLLPPPPSAPQSYPHVTVLPTLTAPAPPTVLPRKKPLPVKTTPPSPLTARVVPETDPPVSLPPAPVVPEAAEAYEAQDLGPWLDLAYLFWWTRPGARTPPVTTTGSPASSRPGALGEPDTRVLLGDRDFQFGSASGLRLNFGRWLSCDGWGVEAGILVLERRADGRAIVSDDSSANPLRLFTPFTEIGVPLGRSAFALPITGTGLFASASLNESRRLYGVDINLIKGLGTSGPITTTLLTGFRFLGLEDSLAYNTETHLINDLNVSLRTLDQWKTQNRFYGWQFGAKFEYRSGQFFINNTTKLAIGATHIHTATEGGVFDNTGSSPQFTRGGIFTNSANLGNERLGRFAVVPDVQVNVGVFLLPNLRTYLGYNFLYWSSILEPGNMIDTRLDLASANPQVPVNLHNTSDFWAQGLSWGFEWQF